MAEESTASNRNASYSLFSFSNPTHLGAGFDLFGSPATPLPPPPPCVEVFLSQEPPIPVSSPEPVVIDDSLTLYKGRVSTRDVFGVSNSDLVPGKYEGGLKLWEGSLDLVKILKSELCKGQLALRGKRVLELGCGHGLPGIFIGLEGAALIHFQDFNAEVLRCLTIPNVKENFRKDLLHQNVETNMIRMCSNVETNMIRMCSLANIRFFAGEWSEIHDLLPCRNADHEEQEEYDGYDVILMAETVYALSSLHNLYKLIKKCLRYPSGVVYMAGKKHYFGVGGGTRQFVHLVQEDGTMEAYLLTEVADGSSNVREVWKFSFK